MSVCACPACPVAPADGTGVAPGDGTGVGLPRPVKFGDHFTGVAKFDDGSMT